MATLHSETAGPGGAESRRQVHSRHRKRGRLTAAAALVVAAFAIVVALIVANTHAVRINWLVGTSTAPLVWVVVTATVLGWLLGMGTSALLRFRTRSAASRRLHPPHDGR